MNVANFPESLVPLVNKSDCTGGFYMRPIVFCIL